MITLEQRNFETIQLLQSKTKPRRVMYGVLPEEGITAPYLYPGC